MTLDEAGIDRARGKIRMTEEPQQKIAIVGDAGNLDVRQRRFQAARCGAA